MNIVLIGMRGSGKTVVGRILAKELGRELVEMDELITRRAGLSIPELVEKSGWEQFRDIEEEIAGEVARMDGIVNATGGGVVTREKNVRELKKNGVLVWLEASVGSMLERVGQDTNRPPLVSGRTPRQDMEITLKERKPLYQKAADLVVSTENRTPEEVAEQIIVLLRQREMCPVVNGATKVCCLFGDPVEHSLSPLIHNAGYKALGINFIYVPFRVKDIRAAVDAIRGLDIRGASITVPHKVMAIKYIDNVVDEAREIGAVNTIVNDNGVLTGYNTDGTGARQALEEATSLDGKKVALIGSGGGALAAAMALRKKGVKLVVLNRTVEKARHLAKLVNADDFGGLDNLPVVSSVDILINATSAGMWPGVNESVIPKELLHDGLIVFDIVYNPKETRLLIEAKEKGCTVVYGYKMLLYQAAGQFELFTGCQAPLPVMERALIEALG